MPSFDDVFAEGEEEADGNDDGGRPGRRPHAAPRGHQRRRPAGEAGRPEGGHGRGASQQAEGGGLRLKVSGGWRQQGAGPQAVGEGWHL